MPWPIRKRKRQLQEAKHLKQLSVNQGDGELSEQDTERSNEPPLLVTMIPTAMKRLILRVKIWMRKGK